VRNLPRSGKKQVILKQLSLPHPEIHRRLFVLVPLAELAPGRIHPVLGRTTAELLANAKRGKSLAVRQLESEKNGTPCSG